MSSITEIIDYLGIRDYRQIQGILIGIIFVLIYAFEHVWPQRKNIMDFRHELFNFSVGVINQLLVFALGIGFYYSLRFSADKQIGLLHLLNISPILKYIVGFVFIDFFMYWWHRLNHQLSFLWFFHHKDKKLNSTSALRFHIGELILSLILRAFVFSLIGIEPLLAIIYESILFFVIVLHHSNVSILEKIDLVLRKLIVSPRMHRIHHSTIYREADSNYSSVFPYWDMIFKTYNKLPASTIEFGLPNLTSKK